MLISLLLAGSAAMAAPVVDPVANPKVGRVRLTSLADLRSTRVRDQACAATDTGCDGWDQRTLTGVELQIALAHGLSVAGNVGYLRTKIKEADFNATGLGYGLAVRGALPINQIFWAALQARLDGGNPSDPGPTGETSTHLLGTLAASLAWGDPDGGFVGHVGVEATPLWQESVETMGSGGLMLELSPTLPASAVAGFSFYSRPLGAAWNGAARAVAHIDATAGQTVGVSAGLGLAF